MRILVLGASGMLGNAVLRKMSERTDWKIYGALRAPNPVLQALAPRAHYIHGIQADQPDSLMSAFLQSRPNIVINCVGLIKQLVGAEDPLAAIPINALLPHRLAKLCELCGSRLIHVSTDCVFSGKRGGYRELDLPDAEDMYGRTKLIGEVDYPHAVTLRTSIIGHELAREDSLIGWFLAQEGCVKGFTEAIFSGLPTCELAEVIRDIVIPNHELTGLYHVAAEPISKYDLLQIVNREYDKGLKIEADNTVKINRSLDAARFAEVTGYVAPKWPDLIMKMHNFQ